LFEDPERPSKEHRKKNVDKTAWNTENVGPMVSLTQKGCAPKVEGRTSFHFDRVFDEDSPTALVYDSIASPMVSGVLDGKHATIFAYGQTGSGKTFTMQGEGKIGSGKAGIIQLVASDLFRLMGKGEALERDFQVKVSYFEIYNEKIRDLLLSDAEIVPADTNGHGANRSDQVQIRTNANGEIVVNVEQKNVDNAEEALQLLVQGNACRTVAATDMNSHSSRSHAVFRLTVESRCMNKQKPVENQGTESLRVSDFNLVDLAGSESVKATNATGNRKREGATINQSLLALTTVIQSLSQPLKKRRQHINYRDSKLTRILQPHLSGNAEMAILCCASPSVAFVEETRSTLKFATRAKLVQVKPQINEVMNDEAMVEKLQKELSEVRKELAAMKIEQEKAREHIYIESNLGKTSDTVRRSDTNGVGVDERTNEFSASGFGCRLDIADPDAARSQRGRVDSFDPYDSADSSQDSTTDASDDSDKINGKRRSHFPTQKSCEEPPIIMESVDTDPSTEACSSFDRTHTNYSYDGSTNMCSQVSSPETLRCLNGGNHRRKSTVGSREAGSSVAPNGRLDNSLLWDAMDPNYQSVAQLVSPLRELENVCAKKHPIPVEVTITDTSLISGNYTCLTDCLDDAEARIKFLEEKLKLSENTIEWSTRDVKRARRAIIDLVYRNVRMNVKLKEKEQEVTEEDYERGEVMVEQYWILKVSLYASVLFFLSRSQEYFLGAAFCVWLALEMSATA